jgi:hypothetical protein
MIYALGKDRAFLLNLSRIARRSPTSAAQHVCAVTSLKELHAAAGGDTEPCVLAAPDGRHEPLEWLRDLQQRLTKPKVIFLLPHDDPWLTFDLLREGVFDVAYRLRFSLTHLMSTLSHAANGARRRPYGTICPTSEFNPCAGSPWAFVICEGLARTDRLDRDTLRLLPLSLGLGSEAMLFLEVLTANLPNLLQMPSLVLALLSSESGEEDRAHYLAALRSLEDDGFRVLYLFRTGVTVSPQLRAAGERLIRHHSAVELFLRLHFGFGGLGFA